MSGLPKLEPMDLIQVSAPFDDPDFLYEVPVRYFIYSVAASNMLRMAAFSWFR